VLAGFCPDYKTDPKSSPANLLQVKELIVIEPAQQEVGKWLMTFRQFPPRQATASFTIDKMMQQMQQMSAMRGKVPRQ